MKTESSLERPDRREFTLAAMLAVLGGVSITLSACGKASSPSMPTPAPSPLADKNGVIGTNHGHVALITGAQLTDANTIVLNLQGTASHNHTLELSAAEVAQIRDGQTVARTCSPTTHMHMVTFN
jgi:hypothetical protein